jgi:NTP pyrophosphatase (non-canonical NTP hydrolase)/nucleoside 2-deoxyribosyltransferase
MKRESGAKVTVSGSFRKHLDEVTKIIEEFVNQGVEILSPAFTKPKNPGDDFVFFHGEESEDPKELENKHLAAIERSDFLYLVNPGGYLGKSATLEMGYALSCGKPVFALDKIGDFTLKLFCRAVGRPKKILREYRAVSRAPLPRLTPRPSLADLQEYIHEVVVERGFADERPHDIMLLLVEEIGELAKALRKHVGLKIDPARKHRYDPLEGELADCLIYLLDLANALEIDFESAFRLKEDENERRFWEKTGNSSSS